MTAFPWLVEALASVRYLEDVRALRHFVFHPRHNGASNLCLVCDCAVDTDGEWATGHLAGCPYPEAVARVRATVGQESLQAWGERQ